MAAIGDMHSALEAIDCRYIHPQALLFERLLADGLFRPGFNYIKAEVRLLNFCQPTEYTDDLFAISQPAEATKVMTVLDEINQRWGKGILRPASVPVNPAWAMRRELMSQSYTTRLEQLWKVSWR